MENIKLVIELILVAQFISAVAIVFLFQRLKFFLDHYNENMKNMVDFVNRLSDDIGRVYDYVNEFADDFEKALDDFEKTLEEARKELEEEQSEE